MLIILRLGYGDTVNGARDETLKLEVLFERTAKEPKWKGHESCPRCTIFDNKNENRGKRGGSRVSAVRYRKLDGRILMVGLERTPTVPSEGNLCTIWGLWETYEGVEGNVGGRTTEWVKIQFGCIRMY
jgi:hypothetical protein